MLAEQVTPPERREQFPELSQRSTVSITSEVMVKMQGDWMGGGANMGGGGIWMLLMVILVIIGIVAIVRKKYCFSAINGSGE